MYIYYKMSIVPEVSHKKIPNGVISLYIFFFFLTGSDSIMYYTALYSTRFVHRYTHTIDFFDYTHIIINKFVFSCLYII